MLQKSYVMLLLGILINQSIMAQFIETAALKQGDILFISYTSGDLSNAIDKVTQTKKNTHYSHMAMVEINDTNTFVIHASLKRGVVKENILSFVRIDRPALIDVYNLKDEYKLSIERAILEANKRVGLPYNSTYILNDTSYYCSQLIYDCFKGDSIFKLEAMTFKSPGTSKFNTGWIEHYKKIGLEIPEGEPGCNPNGMATSEKLIFSGSLSIKGK